MATASASIVAGQKQALELAVGGAPLPRVLEVLVGIAERQCGEGVCASILLLDADGVHLRHGAAPGLPDAYNRAIDGVAIGPTTGSCGTAAFLRRPTVVSDIDTDPLWADYRALARTHGLRACWSTPILSSRGKVLGTFALYYREVRNPTPQDLAFVDFISGTAALVIEREIETRERERVEQRLRDEVRISETLNRVSETLAAELELRPVVQAVIDGAVQLTGAECGAFLCEGADAGGRSVLLQALSGAPQACARLALPRTLAALAEAFRGAGMLRSATARAPGGAGDAAPGAGAVGGEAAAPPLVSVLAVPVTSSSGEVIGALYFGHSEPGRFSERHEQLIVGMAAQAAIAVSNARLLVRLRESSDRLSLALLASDLGNWSWDAATGDVSLSEPAAQIFAVPVGPMSAAVRRGMVHEDDREPVRRAFDDAVAAGTRYHAEYRIRRPDGSEAWVAAHGTPQFAADGKVSGMFGVVQDITPRKRMESELRARALQLAEADRRKDEFLATLAHELRNPLAPLLTSLELLRRPGARDEVKDKALSVMTRQVGQMVRLIDELIDISRITSGKIELRKERLELRSIVEMALEIARPVIDRGRHRINVDLPDTPVHLDIDRTRGAQVLSNILNNAAKYTPPEGRIWLRAEVQEGQVLISVRDTGLGIAPEMLPRIFEMFVQGGRSTPQSHGGLGVGLSLSRRLIELHGGTLEARSEGLDRGSEFLIRLPLGAQGARGAAARRDDALAPATGLRRVLLVDDNADAVESMALILQTDGHEVHTAHDGLAALQAFAQLQPDVVLLDIGLPGMSGYEVARQMRAGQAEREVLLIAATGWGQPKDRELSREAGFDHHLVKPLDITALRKLIEAWPTPAASVPERINDTPGHERRAAVAPHSAQALRPRVLLVDDSVLIQESAAAMLEAEGYEVRTASDGVEAIDIVREWYPRVVFLDVQMPRMNGIEAARALRAEFPARAMALLMMSGMTLNDTWVQHAKAAGFDDCIDKTVAPQVWLQVLRSYADPQLAA